jgi:hypothetical protein
VEAQPAKVNLYQEIPNLEVSLDDFEEFALDRLKVCWMYGENELCWSLLCVFRTCVSSLVLGTFSHSAVSNFLRTPTPRDNLLFMV